MKRIANNAMASQAYLWDSKSGSFRNRRIYPTCKISASECKPNLANFDETAIHLEATRFNNARRGPAHRGFQPSDPRQH